MTKQRYSHSIQSLHYLKTLNTETTKDRKAEQNLRQQLLPKRKQRILSEPWIGIRMLEIQSIAIELADPGCGNYNAVRVLERQDVQCCVYGITKGLGSS